MSKSTPRTDTKEGVTLGAVCPPDPPQHDGAESEPAASGRTPFRSIMPENYQRAVLIGSRANEKNFVTRNER